MFYDVITKANFFVCISYGRCYLDINIDNRYGINVLFDICPYDYVCIEWVWVFLYCAAVGVDQKPV